VNEISYELCEASSSAVVNDGGEQYLVQGAVHQYSEHYKCEEDTHIHSNHSRLLSQHRSRSGDKYSSSRHSASPHRQVECHFSVKFFHAVSQKMSLL